MHRRHLDSSLHDSLEQQAWHLLEGRATGLGDQMDELRAADAATDGTRAERIRALWRQEGSKRGGIVLVDGGRRVLFATADKGIATAEVGGALAWVPSSGGGDEDGGLRRGTLNLADGKHMAVSRAVGHGRGFLVVHQPIWAVEADVAALTGPLRGIEAVTLFWTLAVLTIAVWVVLGWGYDRARLRQSNSLSDVLRQAQSLVRTRDAVIFGLAKLADSRDGDTGEHLERMSAYATTLATALQRHPKYAVKITPAFIREIGISAALHDIGKVGIEDRILLKGGLLSAEERETMQTHTELGGKCLREIEQRLGGSNFLQMAREITLAHHERWNGSGYPQGLAGEAIPLAARIVAIADVYDALRSKRVYKPAIPHDTCVAMIRAEAGESFDPDMIEVWLNIEPQFRKTARTYAPPGDQFPEAEEGQYGPLAGASLETQDVGPLPGEENTGAETVPELSMVD